MNLVGGRWSEVQAAWAVTLTVGEGCIWVSFLAPWLPVPGYHAPTPCEPPSRALRGGDHRDPHLPHSGPLSKGLQEGCCKVFLWLPRALAHQAHCVPQILAATIDSAILVLQIDNARLAADDFRTK